MLDDVGLRLSRRDAGELASRRDVGEARGISRHTDLSEPGDLREFLGREGVRGDEGTARDSERTVRAVLDTMVEAIRSGDVDELKRQLPEGFLSTPPDTSRDETLGQARGRRDGDAAQ